MGATFSIDLISDLNLTAEDEFNWEGKPTSLFCSIAGNISRDLTVVRNTLDHLSNFYRGIMYIDGALEHTDLGNYNTRIEQLREICKTMTNVVYMHNHVVILNSVAFISVNGWFENHPNINDVQDVIRVEDFRIQDLSFLGSTIKNLQHHRDAKKIIITTSCAPNEHLLFKKPGSKKEIVEPELALAMDTEDKVDVWMYGGTNVIADEITLQHRFVNNPCIPGQPYWPKRILV
jgi:hypothetical protein